MNEEDVSKRLARLEKKVEKLDNGTGCFFYLLLAAIIVLFMKSCQHL